MTVHHDKKAYGKLAPLNESLSDQKLAEIVRTAQLGEQTLKHKSAAPADGECDGEKQPEK